MSVPTDQIYAALMGNVPTDQEHMTALANALRGQKLVGQLGMLSGDPYAGGIGKNLDTSADQQAEYMGQERLKENQLASEAAWRQSQEQHQRTAEEQAASALHETIREHNLQHQEKQWEYGFNPNGTPDSAFENDAQAIAHYEMAPPNMSMSRNPRNAALLGRVNDIAQKEGYTYDQTLYDTKKKGQEYFTSGAGGNLLQSGGTAVNHLNTLRTALENLNNTNLPIWNQIKNKVKTWTGSPDVTNWDTLKKQVADEVAKFAVANNAAGGSAVFDREAMENLADNAKGHAQLSGMMDQWQALMKGRAQEMKQRYENTIPDFPNSRYRRKEFENFMDESSRAALGMPNATERAAAAKGNADPFAGFKATPIP